MKRMILMTTAAALALWGNALLAQNDNPAPAENPTKVQKRDRIHVTDGTGPYHDQNQAQKGNPSRKGNNGKQVKAKQGPGDGTGNLGERPQDGAGYGAQSGRRSGPMDGSKAGWENKPSGRRGSLGGSAGTRSSRRGRR